MNKYFQPKSVTWWSAVAEAAVNVARIWWAIPPQVDGLILAVFGIGVRGAIGGPK